MKSLIKILLLVFMPVFLNAQVNPLFIGSTKKQAYRLDLVLKQTTNDTIRMESLRELALYYFDFQLGWYLYQYFFGTSGKIQSINEFKIEIG